MQIGGQCMKHHVIDILTFQSNMYKFSKLTPACEGRHHNKLRVREFLTASFHTQDCDSLLKENLSLSFYQKRDGEIWLYKYLVVS